MAGCGRGELFAAWKCGPGHVRPGRLATNRETIHIPARTRHPRVIVRAGETMIKSGTASPRAVMQDSVSGSNDPGHRSHSRAAIRHQMTK
jgi:hypothetical protein